MCVPPDPAAKGMKCELVTTGCEPRLEVNVSDGCYRKGDNFQDHVLASLEPDGKWRFWWPFIQPIAPVEDMAQAVDYILEVYRDDYDDEQ